MTTIHNVIHSRLAHRPGMLDRYLAGSPGYTESKPTKPETPKPKGKPTTTAPNNSAANRKIHATHLTGRVSASHASVVHTAEKKNRHISHHVKP